MIVAVVIVVLVVVAALVLASSNDPRVRRIADFGWTWLIFFIWIASAALIWFHEADTEAYGWIDAPSVVALSLGSIVIVVFTAVYLRESGRTPSAPGRHEATDPDGGTSPTIGASGEAIRASIAIAFVVFFLLLVVDILAIKEFRDSLSDVRDVTITITNEKGSSTTQTITTCPEGASGPSGPVDATGGATCIAAAGATSFVEGLLGVFKWGITAIIVFYFGAGIVDRWRRPTAGA